jgi:uncharacterized protein YutE (UPF0331/DUF86 family)
MIANLSPDNQKAESLRKMAEITLERLQNTDMEKYASNTLLDYYDAIHNLMEAITAMEGIKVRGEGAHQELIDYLAKRRIFNEQTRQFLQNMRDFRNRISYEGFTVHSNYIKLNKGLIEKTIKSLIAHMK